MALGTAASFAETYTRRVHPVKCSKALNAFSSAVPAWRGSTAQRSPEMRTQPMVPAAEVSASKQRSERRISVRLPLKVRGRDARGITFEEETASENLCRNGAAFVTRFDVAIGSDLEIRIPFSRYASRRAPRTEQTEKDFATSGRVVHVADAQQPGEHLIGVQFTGPRFQRVFRSESAA